MKLINIISSLLFLSTSITFGQVDKLNNFTYLKAKGEIPSEFLTLSADKYKEDFEANKNKDLDRDFFLSTRFFIDELLLSGNVLFNDELSTYVNKVAKNILKREKGLYKELQFYVLKNNSVNAFSTDQGIIFVTTGLLAQLENEAQLAFILAHEVAHFTEHHVRDGYVESKNIKKGKGKYNRLSYEEKVGELSIYSKDNEHDADTKGIEIFLKSQYDVETIFTSFEVLLYAYLPFQDTKFDTAYFNTENLIIPGNAFPDSINQISREEDYDDHLSTHPNVQKRMDKAFDVIGDRDTKGTKKYIISETTFKLVRNLARFESINQNLANRQYVDAIYSIYLLQKKFPNNKFLDFSLAKALYGLAKYKNNFRFNEVILKLKNTEGEQYRLAYFFKHLSKAQLNVISYRVIYDMSIKYRNDNLIKKYEKDMLKELTLKSNIKPNQFIAIDSKTYSDSLSTLIKSFDIQDSIAKIDANDNLSKYKKIKLKKSLYKLQNKETLSVEETEFHLSALADLVINGKLEKKMNLILAENDLEISNREKNKRENLYKKNPKEKGLNIQKVVVVDPYMADYNLSNKKDNVKSEKKKIELNQMYLQTHSRLNIETAIVDSKSLTKKDVAKYNELGLLYQWISEILEHDEIEMISSLNQDMQPIKEKYNTSKFLFSGFVKYKNRKEFSSNHLIGLFLVYTAPIAIIDLLIVHHYFDTFAFAIDSDNDKVIYTQSENVNLRANKHVLDAYIYNLLYNLNKK